MKDADYDAQQARVKALFEKWAPVLLPEWRVDIDYYDEPYQGDSEERRAGNWRSAFRIVSVWDHLLATVSAYCPDIEPWSDERLEEAVIHECMHARLNELRDNPDDWLSHEERVATQLARGIQRVMRVELSL